MKRAPEVKRVRTFDALDVRTRVLLGVALGTIALSAVLNALGRSPLLLFVTSASPPCSAPSSPTTANPPGSKASR